MKYWSPRNIYIVGAQSTGKTTLVDALEKSSNDPRNNPFCAAAPAVVNEVARSMLAAHAFTADDITSDTERCAQLQSLILEAQFKREREALKTSGWIISDRSGVDPIVYAHRYAGPEAVGKMMATSHWREVYDRMSTSLIFVCEAGVDWLEDDGVRLMPTDMEEWVDCHRDFCRILDQVGLRYLVVPRTMLGLEERTSFVWSKWRGTVLPE